MAQDEPQFKAWYARMAEEHGLDPNPDSPQQHYDYRAAFKANAKPDASGHWPSDFKREGHENLVVGGFNTKTGERVPGTPQASESELVQLGWDAATAKRLSSGAVMAEPQTPTFDQVVPEFGGIGIPSDLTPEEKAQFQAAMTRRFKQENPGKKQPPKTNWIDDAVDWLPMAGGTLGGIIGASTGVATFGLSGVPGAVAGGAVGGMAGEAAKQTINRLRGREAPTTPSEAASAIGVQGVTQGALELARIPASAAKAVAPTLMRTALGNTEAVLSRRPDVAKVALKTGATVTRSGIQKLDDLLAAKSLGVADRAAIDMTREAVANAWKRTTLEQSKTLFGATAGNPAFRSAMAQGLYHAAGVLGHLSPQAIRAALIGADAMTKSEQE